MSLVLLGHAFRFSLISNLSSPLPPLLCLLLCLLLSLFFLTLPPPRKLFPWVCRHDGAYSTAFKAPCNLASYPNIRKWALRVSRMEGVADSVDIEDAVGSYYKSLFMLNPSAIVPAFEKDMEKLFAA